MDGHTHAPGARVRGTLTRLLAVLGALAAVLLVSVPVASSAASASTAPTLAAAAADDETVTLTVFWGDGCPRCTEQEGHLDRLAEEHPTLQIERFEVFNDEANQQLFRERADELGIDAGSVPTTILGERVWIGFTDAIQADVDRTVAAAVAGEPVPAGLYGTAGEGTCDATTCTAPEEETVDIPLLGERSAADTSLVLSTLAIGFVDGINPCSLWVISILLTIVIRTGSRGRVLLVGSTFLLVTAAMYALYMVGVYSALTVIGYLGAVQIAIGVAAGVFGAINLKDYFAFKRGVSLTIRDESKPGIYQRMRRIATQRSLAPALAATVALGVGVSLLETPCTAGFPVLWTGLLAANDASLAQSAGLFGLYMVPFLIDEFAVFLVAVATMRAARLHERHGRVLKLIAGTTMVALAAVLVVRPEIMEDVVGAMLVFVGAGVAAALIHTGTLVRRRLLAGSPPSGDDGGSSGGPGTDPGGPAGSPDAGLDTGERPGERTPAGVGAPD